MIFYYVALSKLLHEFAWLIALVVTPLSLYCITFTVKRFAKQTAIDAIEVYSHLQTARANIAKMRLDDKFNEDSRRARLTAWQRQARAQITQQRTALQLGSEAMWKMGVFDIEVDEVAK